MKSASDSTPLDIHSELDAFWLAKPSSPAARMSIASRAAFEIQGPLLAPWGKRFAEVFEEFHRCANPLASDGASFANPAAGMDSAHNNLRHSMSWAFFEAIAERADLEALLACFHALPEPIPPRAGGHSPAEINQLLFQRLIPSLIADGRLDDLAGAIRAGGAVTRFHLPELISHGGRAMDHPELGDAARDALAEFAKDYPSASGQKTRIHAAYHPMELYACPHPAWRALFIESFKKDKADRLELKNLEISMGHCRRMMAASPENVAKSNAEDQAAGRRARKCSTYPMDQRLAAKEMGLLLEQRWSAALEEISNHCPSMAARILIESHADLNALHGKWNALGLGEVDAAAFLFDPHEEHITGGVRSMSAHRRKASWPAWDSKGEGRSAMEGSTLSFLDCLALSGCSKDVLEQQAQLGRLPSDGLRKATDCKNIRLGMDESELIWLASFTGAPNPSKSKRLLKA